MDVAVALGAMAVRAGGCSGMSYVMDLTKLEDVDENDTIVNLDENMRCVIDPKSLMFLYGMQLDYSDELIGGGFSFSNPNAEETCGCGKSCVPVVCHFRWLSTQGILSGPGTRFLTCANGVSSPAGSASKHHAQQRARPTDSLRLLLRRPSL